MPVKGHRERDKATTERGADRETGLQKYLSAGSN